jgi:formate-dependent phosphoribosylglycinamide formyltransferase (GAR transformylase)
MAQEWCVLYGVLEEKQAAKLYEQICKRKGKPVVISSSQTSSSSSSSNNNKATSTTTTKKATTTISPQKQVGRKRKVIVEDEIEGDIGKTPLCIWFSFL